MSLCESIDTLAMAYLDDELAGEERRELELHLGECTSCKGHLETERTEISFVRKALVPPLAPDMLKARVARALDAEDKTVAAAGRKKWQSAVLPGLALAVGAAALAFFFFGAGLFNGAEKRESSAVAHEVLRQQTRSLPLEVQGQQTGPWLRANFPQQFEPPQFEEPGIQLIGARATAIAGHDAAQLRYLVSVDGVNRVSLTAMLIADLRGDELQGGQSVKMGRLTLHVYDIEGLNAVTYVDENRIGYVFTSERMTLNELLSLVGTSDLISRAQQQR